MKNRNELLSGLILATGGYFVYKMVEKNNSHNNIKIVIQNWVDTVGRHNAKDKVELYARNGVLLGTLAKSMKIGKANILPYFDMFVKKKPSGKITKIHVQNFGTDYAVADGTYTFHLLNDDGAIDIVLARFTFVLRKINGNWKITTHHSSVQP